MEYNIATKEDIIQTHDIKVLKDDVCEHGKTLTTITETLSRMEKKLDPISKNYEVATTLGKWFLAVLVFLATLGTALVTFTKIFQSK